MSSDIYRDSIFWVEVERIKPNPFQPRREFDQGKLQELADSIRMYGLLQPLTVTRKEIPREDGGLGVEYELIAGERRLRASKLAGIVQVPVIIRVGEETDQMKLELAIIENLQREDLNPVDRAKAFHRLYHDFKFTHGEIGKKVGKSREYVSNTLRLLLLPELLLSHIAEGRITEGHTRPLLMLNDKPEEQGVLAKEIMLKKLTVRETEAIARRAAQDKVSARYRMAPELLAMERELTEKFGTRVTIEPREVGGRVVISFFSPDDLQSLLDSMHMEQNAAVISAICTNATEGIGSADGAVPEVETVVVDVQQPVVEPEPVIEIVRAADPVEVMTAEPAVEDIREVSSERVDASPAPAFVVPDPTLPHPEVVVAEPAPAPVQQEPIAAPVVVAASPVVTSIESPLQQRGVPVQEEESDLYSIRNFSI